MENTQNKSTGTGQSPASISSPKKVVFTPEEEEMIINHYQQHEFLWNPKYENYKFAWKTTAVKDLAIAMGNKFTPSDIHERFSAMRSTYRANANKVKASSTGSQATDLYVPSWQHYESMKFLDATQPSRTSVTSYNVNRDDNMISELEYLDECDDLINNSAPASVQGSSSIKTARNPKNKMKDDEVLDECLGILRTVTSSNENNNTAVDRHQHFGNYVASCLREMLPCYQSCAFAVISNVLLKYDKHNPNDENY